MIRVKNSRRVLLFQVYSVWRGVESDMRLPLGMLYLGGSLKQAGYEVQVFHIEETRIDEELARLDLSDVLFVGVCSVLTGFSLRCAIAFSKRVKELEPDLPIIWGGVQPTAIPEACLAEPFVDGVGLGDGDEVIVQIAQVFRGELDPATVKSFAYKDAAGVPYVNKRADPVELTKYKPDYSLIDLNRYIFNRRITGLMMSSRGCPYACTFCYNDYFSKRRWRKHSGDYVLDTLDDLRDQYDFDAFSFSDDLFFVDRARAMSLLKGLHERNLRTYAVDIKVNFIGDEEIRAIGQYQVESCFFGLETLNQRLLHNMEKKQTNEQIRHMLRRFADLAPDVNLQTGILMGLPFERRDELIQDIRDGVDLMRLNPNLSIYFGNLFPLPGTRMMEVARQNGFDPKTVYDYAEIDLNNAWRLSHQWLLWHVDDETREALRLTEQYSQIMALPGAIWQERHDRSARARAQRLIQRGVFEVGRARLKRWFFTGHELDELVFRNSYRIAEVLTAPLDPQRIARKVARLGRSVLGLQEAAPAPSHPAPPPVGEPRVPAGAPR